MIIKFVSTILVAILGLILVNTFNIFNFFSFVPKDYAFEIGITVYFTLLEILVEKLIKYIKSEYCSEISMFFSHPKDDAIENGNPNIVFDSNGLARVNVTVDLKGKKKNFKNFKVVIPKIPFATMQLKKYKEFIVDDKENCVLDLFKMFGETSEKLTLTNTYQIDFIKDYGEINKTFQICPECTDKPFLIPFKCNYAIIKIKEK